jgi:hypothetical protein
VTNPTPRRIAGTVRFLRISPDKKDDGLPARPTAQENSPDRTSDDALALAHMIHRAGLGSPAVFMLDALKPLHWLGGQAVWLVQPFIAALGPGFGRDVRIGGLSSGALARLLERDGGLDDLALHLEQLQRAGKEGGNAPS